MEPIPNICSMCCHFNINDRKRKSIFGALKRCLQSRGMHFWIFVSTVQHFGAPLPPCSSWGSRHCHKEMLYAQNMMIADKRRYKGTLRIWRVRQRKPEVSARALSQFLENSKCLHEQAALWRESPDEFENVRAQSEPTAALITTIGRFCENVERYDEWIDFCESRRD